MANTGFDVIGAVVGGPELRQRFIELIPTHPNLVRPEPRPGLNPFTKKPIVIAPRQDCANVIVDGRIVGWMGCAPEPWNQINVWAVPGTLDAQAVEAMADEIAKASGGQLREPGGEES